MPEIPTDDRLDSTLALLGDPYGYIQRTSRQLGSDVFQARIMLEPTVCLTGPEAAELVYDEERFQREGASPVRVQKTLFGEGGVQGLDDEAHRRRKQLFVDLTGPEHARELAASFDELWQARARQWARADEVAVYDEVRQMLTRAVLDWAGVPADEAEIPDRASQLSSLFEHAGSLGPMHWKSRIDRWRGDRWAGELVQAVRTERLSVADDSPLAQIARHRDADGSRLEPRVAGVELLNLLRPTVAVAVYVTFVAHARQMHPDWDESIEAEAERRRWFADEVRRLYPLFPAVAARTRRSFTWQGHRFPEGRRVLLDLHGTNTDPRAWANPQRFRPERFRGAERTPYDFVPQGGGEAAEGHRCPGEEIALALMETALARLEAMDYEVPDQDLSIDLRETPPLPASGFVLADVEPGPPGPTEGGADIEIGPPEGPRLPSGTRT